MKKDANRRRKGSMSAERQLLLQLACVYSNIGSDRAAQRTRLLKPHKTNQLRGASNAGDAALSWEEQMILVCQGIQPRIRLIWSLWLLLPLEFLLLSEMWSEKENSPGLWNTTRARTRGGDKTRKDGALTAPSFIDGDNWVRKMKDGFQHSWSMTVL